MTNDIMQKVAEVAPRQYEFLCKTAAEVNASPFRDEILGEMNVLIKKALDWNALKGGLRAGAGMMGRGAAALGGAVGAAAVGGIALALAGDMYDAAKRGITKGRDYKSMMKENPALQRLPAKEVQKAFSVLHRFNPEFASDPTVAGAWVGRQVQVTSMNPDSYADSSMLKGLVDSRKNIADVKKISPFKIETQKKAPPGLSRGDLDSGFGGIHDRLTSLEQNLGPLQFYGAPGGGQRTTP